MAKGEMRMKKKKSKAILRRNCDIMEKENKTTGGYCCYNCDFVSDFKKAIKKK